VQVPEHLQRHRPVHRTQQRRKITIAPTGMSAPSPAR
jgi:hypothetical protein